MVDSPFYDTNQYLFYFYLNYINVCECAWTELELDRSSKTSQLDLIRSIATFNANNINSPIE